jgi:hypothetical protein
VIRVNQLPQGMDAPTILQKVMRKQALQVVCSTARTLRSLRSLQQVECKGAWQRSWRCRRAGGMNGADETSGRTSRTTRKRSVPAHGGEGRCMEVLRSRTKCFQGQGH